MSCRFIDQAQRPAGSPMAVRHGSARLILPSFYIDTSESILGFDRVMDRARDRFGKELEHNTRVTGYFRQSRWTCLNAPGSATSSGIHLIVSAVHT